MDKKEREKLLAEIMEADAKDGLYEPTEPDENISTDGGQEVIRVHNVFFDQPFRKQREVLRLLIGWAIKHYFKILFK